MFCLGGSPFLNPNPDHSVFIPVTFPDSVIAGTEYFAPKNNALVNKPIPVSHSSLVVSIALPESDVCE